MIPLGAHAAALGLLLLDVLVRAARLRVLLGRHPLALRAAVVVNAIGDAASAVTPARLGGEPARFVGLGRYGAPMGARVVALGAERILDLALAAAVALAAVVLLGGSGFADLHTIAGRLTSDRARPWLAGVALAVVVSGVVAVRLRHRLRPAVTRSLGEALDAVRGLPPARLFTAMLLTAVSMLARVAILPVLLAGIGVRGPIVTAAAGSFALIYAQLLLPTPAGAGGVELGFVAGVSPLLSAPETAVLLVTWRVYTLVLPAGIGAGMWFATRAAGPKRETDG